MIIAPLIMLPKRRTARASVRESSLMMLNGSMITRRLHVGLQIAAPTPAPRCRRPARRRTRRARARRSSRASRRRLIAGNDRAEAGRRDEQKQRAQKAEVLFAARARPDLADLLLMPVTTISSRFCQRERFSSVDKLPRDELRADGQHEHQRPGEHDGGVELERSRAARRSTGRG